MPAPSHCHSRLMCVCTFSAQALDKKEQVPQLLRNSSSKTPWQVGLEREHPQGLVSILATCMCFFFLESHLLSKTEWAFNKQDSHLAILTIQLLVSLEDDSAYSGSVTAISRDIQLVLRKAQCTQYILENGANDFHLFTQDH